MLMHLYFLIRFIIFKYINFYYNLFLFVTFYVEKKFISISNCRYYSINGFMLIIKSLLIKEMLYETKYSKLTKQNHMLVLLLNKHLIKVGKKKSSRRELDASSDVQIRVCGRFVK